MRVSVAPMTHLQTRGQRMLANKLDARFGFRLPALTLVLAAALGACGGGDDGDGGGGSGDAGGSGSGNPTCTLTATATADKTARTITGVGSVSCSGSATVALEVCVQWNPSGSFVDIQCQSGTMSGVSQHSVQNLSSCGLGSGRMFRTRANASINGTALAEVLSSTVACE